MTNYDILKEYEAHKTPVPSYDELQNMNKAVNECMAANIKLVEQNAQLKEQINHLSKTQARQFVDNQKLQIKAEKAKDVVNIDTARQIKQLKELLKECKQWFDWYHIDIGTGKEYIESWHKKGHEIHKQLDEALK